MKANAYKKYMLALLAVILSLSFSDTLALGLVLQDIKADLQLTDTELGFLSGLAFAFFYAIMGVPIARWADRGNRSTIIWLTTGAWSIMVFLCGLAATFTQLLLVRVGVAVGQSGAIPPAHSLLADYFDRAERPKAVGVYMLGAAASGILGYFFAGWLNQYYGWRMMFILLSLPGMVAAILAYFTLREPRRAHAVPVIPGQTETLFQVEAPIQADQPELREVLAALWANRTFRNLSISYSVMYFFNWGFLQWKPAFFIRSFHMDTGVLGTWFAIIYGAGAISGTYFGGRLASRFAPNDERRQLQAMALVVAGAGLVTSGTFLSPNLYIAFSCMFVASVMNTLGTAPLFSSLQTLVPSNMRSMSVAIMFLFANLIGMGLGPVATGMISDAFQPRFGDESLRYALLSLCPGFLFGGWFIWLGSRTVLRDIKATHDIEEAEPAK